MSGKSLLVRCSIFFLITPFFQACESQDFYSQDSNRSVRLESPKVDPGPPEPQPEATLPTEEENETQPIFDNCDARLDRSITADLYRLQQGTEYLPDFSQMTALKKVCLKQLDITDRDFKEGFPGVEGLDEWFALGIEFQVEIKESGYYHFDLSSDDGSKLYVNGQVIIDNDGQHSVQEVAGGIDLSAGIHILRLEYFQGPRYRIALELFWTPPYQVERSYIPNTLMSRTVQ